MLALHYGNIGNIRVNAHLSFPHLRATWTLMTRSLRAIADFNRLENAFKSVRPICRPSTRHMRSPTLRVFFGADVSEIEEDRSVGSDSPQTSVFDPSFIYGLDCYVESITPELVAILQAVACIVHELARYRPCEVITGKLYVDGNSRPGRRKFDRALVGKGREAL